MCLECLGAIMACTTGLPCVHACHSKLDSTFFHLEDFCVAGIAFEPLVRMDFSIKPCLRGYVSSGDDQNTSDEPVRVERTVFDLEIGRS